MAKSWSLKSNKSEKKRCGDDRDHPRVPELRPRRGERGGKPPSGLGGLGGSEVQNERRVWWVRKGRIGKKRDWKNGGRAIYTQARSVGRLLFCYFWNIGENSMCHLKEIELACISISGIFQQCSYGSVLYISEYLNNLLFLTIKHLYIYIYM